MATKCDIIRAAVAATLSSRCGVPCQQASDCPAGQTCLGAGGPGGGLACGPVPAECAALAAAKLNDLRVQTQYCPKYLADPGVRRALLRNISNDIATAEQTLAGKFGAGAATDVAWLDFPLCLWNPDGQPGGPNNSKYFTRQDLALLGYAPRPLAWCFSSAAAPFPPDAQVPAAVQEQIPVWMDRVLNPGLAALLIFAIVLILAAVFIYEAYRQRRERAAGEKKPRATPRGAPPGLSGGARPRRGAP